MKKIFNATLLALGAAMLIACGHSHKHEHEHGAEAEAHNHGDAIVMTKHQAEQAGVKTWKVKRGTFQETVAVSGELLPASGEESTVSATVSGIVKLVRPLSEGMQLGSGTRIMTISSRGLQEGDAVQKARIAYETARQQYERDSLLVKDRIVSERHFLESKAALEQARLSYEALGQGRGEGTAVAARQGGYVQEMLVRDGDYVEVGQPLLRLTSDRKLYLRAWLPVRYNRFMGSVTSARFRTSGGQFFSLDEMGGQLVGSNRVVNAAQPYMSLTFQLNGNGDMVPGECCDIWLLGAQRENVLTIPNEAITEQQGAYYVYLRHDAEHYHKQPVTLGATDGRRTEVLKGLHGGENLVVKGAMQVRLAGAGGVIPGHSHEH